MSENYSTDNKTHHTLFNKHDIRLLILLLLVILVMLVVRMLISSHESHQVLVSVDSVQVASFPLDADTTYAIESADGGYNLLHIEAGRAYITDASCPDKICEHEGSISHSGEMIICLPNRVVVSIVD